jgi:hypothetical protein
MSTMVKEVTPSNQGSMQLHTGINTKTHTPGTLLQRKWQLVKCLPFSKQMLNTFGFGPRSPYVLRCLPCSNEYVVPKKHKYLRGKLIDI